jgi:hypothetical protein
MKISKSRYINLSRCPRTTALYDIKDNELKSFSNFSNEMEEFENLRNLERLDKIKVLYDNMIFDDEEDEENSSSSNNLTKFIVDTHENKLLEIYNEIERLAAEAVRYHFGGNIVYARDTRNQKYFKTWYEDYEFYCFLDIYQEDDEKIRIFEVKASSDSSLHNNLKNKKESSKYYILNNHMWEFRENLDKGISNNLLNKVLNRFGSDKLGSQLFDINYQKFVVDSYHQEHKINKPVEYYLVLLNSKYVFDGKYVNNKPYYDPKEIVRFFNVTKIFKYTEKKFFNTLDITINNLNHLNANPTKLGSHCQRTNPTRKCEFLNICFKDKNIPDTNSVFSYDQYHYGFKNGYTVYELIEKGITRIEDVSDDLLKNEKQIIQKEATVNNTPHIERKMIDYGLTLLKYPIYHLDFETLNWPLPRFKGEKCYQQSPFQFSIHIEREPGKCDKNIDNISFLATDNTVDQREELIKLLVDTIKDDGGTIMAYHSSFERDRIEELASMPQFKDKYGDKLNSYVKDGRIFDLKHLVKGNKEIFSELDEKHIKKDYYARRYCYYNKDQSGSFSIKKILPVFSNLSYKEMTISQGTEASAAYNVFNELSDEQLTEVREALLEYCKQDTWAMFLILCQLRRLHK